MFVLIEKLKVLNGTVPGGKQLFLFGQMTVLANFCHKLVHRQHTKIGQAGAGPADTNPVQRKQASKTKLLAGLLQPLRPGVS
jgi:hypothetical protein